MDVRTVKHAAKMEEWAERIRECRSSGVPVRAWCKEQGISIKTYYRWERLYMAEASARMEANAMVPSPAGQLVRIDPEQLSDPEEVVADANPLAEPSFTEGFTLRYGRMSVEMPIGIKIAEIAELMKALAE